MAWSTSSEDRSQGTEDQPQEQGHDRPLSLHSKLSDTSWLDTIRLPMPCTERHIDRRRRLEARDRLLAASLTGEWVSYSRNWNQWPPRRYLPFGRRIVSRGIEFLAEHGLFEHDQRRPGERGWQSRFRATQPLLLIARKTRPIFVPGETIWLRDEDGRPVDYRDTAEIRAMRRRVETLNEALAATVIDLAADAPLVRVRHMLQIDEHQSLSISERGLHRVFNRSSFALGGRFYGGFWQSLPKAIRPHLTLDGAATVEIDYSGCHIRMLAAELGVDLGDEDLYEIRGWRRDEAKPALLVLINAPDRRSAIGRIAQDLGGGDRSARRAVALIEAIKARHPRLAPAFHSDAGSRLMRLDSDISDLVFLRLLKRGIVALGVHDSNIVAAKYAGDLRAEMERAWWAKVGTRPVVK